MTDSATHASLGPGRLLDELGRLHRTARRDRRASVAPLVAFGTLEVWFGLTTLSGTRVSEEDFDTWNTWNPDLGPAGYGLPLTLLLVAGWFQVRRARDGVGHGRASAVMLAVASVLVGCTLPHGVWTLLGPLSSGEVYAAGTLLVFALWQRDWFVAVWAAVGTALLAGDAQAFWFTSRLPSDLGGWTLDEELHRGPGVVVAAVGALFLLGALTAAATTGRRR